jgi:hypothetical protein
MDTMCHVAPRKVYHQGVPPWSCEALLEYKFLVKQGLKLCVVATGGLEPPTPAL